MDFARLWWFSTTGNAEIALLMTRESTFQERLDLCCRFVLSSVRLIHAILGSESVENVRCGG